MKMTNVHDTHTTAAAAAEVAFSAPLAALPIRVPRKRAAEILTQYYFKTEPRTLERAPLRWQRLNGKAHVLTSELCAWAESRLAEAPSVMGGRRTAEAQTE